MNGGYRTLSRDTSAVAEALVIEGWRRKSPSEKLEELRGLNRFVEQLGRAGILARHPGTDARGVLLRLASQRLDRETMIRLYGWDPAREGY